MVRKAGVAAMIVMAGASSAWAGTCALCRQALASGGRSGLVQGFYWSILLITGMPLVIMAVIGVIVWRQRRGQAVSTGRRIDG